MTFISYEQYLENVILWRALKKVEKGFYIDAGACEPQHDSVSHAFYEMGGHGLSVEPNPEFLAQLQAARVQDANIGVALSDGQEERDFYVVPETGWSTLDQDDSEPYLRSGYRAEPVPLKTTTPEQLWKNQVPQQ